MRRVVSLSFAVLCSILPLFTTAQILDPCLQESERSRTRLLIPIEDDCPADDVFVSLSGPGTANVNDYDYYYANVSGAIHYSTSYYVYGGTIISQSKTYVRVRWTSSGTNRYVRANISTNRGFFTKYKYVTVSPGPPPTPDPITVSSNTCGNKTLTRGNPQSGITWFWQTSSNGTSMASSAKTYPLNSSGTRYLRARNNSSGLWSTSSRSSGHVTVNPYPTLPDWAIVGVTPYCGYSVIYKSDAAESNNWYWQGTNPFGTSMDNRNVPYPVTSSGTYYLRARSSAGCWSQSRSIDVVIDNGPDAPTINNISYGFNGATITRNNPPGNETWFWQATSDGTSTGNSSQTKIANAIGEYHLRSKFNGGCWGDTYTFNYLAKEPQTIVASTNSHESIKISWSGTRGNETGFVISRSAQPNGAFTAIHTASGSASEYVDSGLDFNSTWYYKVQAVVNSQKSTGLQTATASTERLTAIPDTWFEWYLNRNYPELSDGISGYVKTGLIEVMTSLYIPNVYNYNNPATITNLQGIQDFTSVETINLHRHDLSSLDLSNNTQLKHLTYTNYVDHRDLPDELSCIQVSQGMLNDPTINWNIASYISLSTDCANIPRTAIPGGNFENLLMEQGYDNIRDGWVNTDKINTIEELRITNDWTQDITGIEDFSALRELRYTVFSGSGLTVTPDLSQNENLNHISIYGHLNLECIKVSQQQLDNPSIYWNINTWLGRTTGNCELINIDGEDWEQALYENGYLWSPYYDNNISVALAETITELDFSGHGIRSLNKLEYFTSLESLDCSGCRLQDDDLGVLASLPNLKYLNLSSNNFRKPDISSFPSIESLDIRNHQWLTCIQVSASQLNDPNLSIQKDAHAGLSLDCANQQLTYIPSGTNFETALIDLGYDNVRDNYVVTDAIDDITHLYISNKNIYGLEGIQDFTALEHLDCSNNLIGKSIDLSNNANLNRAFTSGNLSLNCIKVTQDQIDNVTWFKNSYTGLTTEDCTETFIPDNNFEQALIDEGYDNLLNDFVSNSIIKDISSLSLQSKQIYSLDGIASFENLQTLNCSSNNLYTLDLSQNPNLVNVFAYANNLNCIQVNEDQLLNRVQNWNKDNNTIWSLDCSSPPPSSAARTDSAEGEMEASSEEIVLSSEFSLDDIGIYPNPANNYVNISGTFENTILRVTDLQGKELYRIEDHKNDALRIDTSGFKDGIYLIQVLHHSGETIERKLVVKH